MFQLIIKRPDDTIYWTDHFNSLADAEKWIEVEQTRSYWDVTYTFKIFDHSPKPPSEEEKSAKAAAEAVKKSQIDAVKSRLNELDGLPDLTGTELKENVRKILRLFKLKGLLD